MATSKEVAILFCMINIEIDENKLLFIKLILLLRVERHLLTKQRSKPLSQIRR